MREHPADIRSDQGAPRRQWVAPRIKRLVAGEAEFSDRQNSDTEGTS